MAEFITVGAGWRSKKGSGYSVKIEVALQVDQRIFIFSNKNKKNDKHPDIILGYYEDVAEKQQERDQRPNEPPLITDDSIPF
jgi:hypothetical protein